MIAACKLRRADQSIPRILSRMQRTTGQSPRYWWAIDTFGSRDGVLVCCLFFSFKDFSRWRRRLGRDPHQWGTIKWKGVTDADD